MNRVDKSRIIKGFTLIEIIIVLGILVVVSVATWSMMGFGSRTFSRSTAYADLQFSARMAAEKISNQFRYASADEVDGFSWDTYDIKSNFAELNQGLEYSLSNAGLSGNNLLFSLTVVDPKVSTNTFTLDSSVTLLNYYTPFFSGDSLLLTKPHITLEGPSVMTVNMGSVYTELNAIGIDYNGDDISSQILFSGVVNTAIPYVYYVRYNLVNSSGTAADEVIRKVIVKEPLDLAVVDISGVGNNNNQKSKTAKVIYNNNIATAVATEGVSATISNSSVTLSNSNNELPEEFVLTVSGNDEQMVVIRINRSTATYTYSYIN